jgi:hypothetical protein
MDQATKSEDDRATELLVQLRERGHRKLAAKLAGRIGSDNEGARLSAIHEAEAYLQVSARPES